MHQPPLQVTKAHEPPREDAVPPQPAPTAPPPPQHLQPESDAPQPGSSPRDKSRSPAPPTEKEGECERVRGSVHLSVRPSGPGGQEAVGQAAEGPRGLRPSPWLSESILAQEAWLGKAVHTGLLGLTVTSHLGLAPGRGRQAPGVSEVTPAALWHSPRFCSLDLPFLAHWAEDIPSLCPQQSPA